MQGLSSALDEMLHESYKLFYNLLKINQLQTYCIEQYPLCSGKFPRVIVKFECRKVTATGLLAQGFLFQSK